MDTYLPMDISGILQSYDARATSSAALARAVMVPPYGHSPPYAGATPTSLGIPHHPMQQNPFTYGAYSVAAHNGVISAFTTNYLRQRPLPRLTHPGDDGSRGVSYVRNDRHGVEDHRSNSAPIKSETQWSVPFRSPAFTSPKTKTVNAPLPNGTADVNFGTEVDTLMKAIQAKSQLVSVPPQQSSPEVQSIPVVGGSFDSRHAPPVPEDRMHADVECFKLTSENVQDEASNSRGDKKRYKCTIEGCSRSFYQKTHLEIHVRAHTGDKPYVGRA
jgi:hypothetical protein